VCTENVGDVKVVGWIIDLDFLVPRLDASDHASDLATDAIEDHILAFVFDEDDRIEQAIPLDALDETGELLGRHQPHTFGDRVVLRSRELQPILMRIFRLRRRLA
jgi:hypothetical protein